MWGFDINEKQLTVSSAWRRISPSITSGAPTELMRLYNGESGNYRSALMQRMSAHWSTRWCTIWKLVYTDNMHCTHWLTCDSAVYITRSTADSLHHCALCPQQTLQLLRTFTCRGHGPLHTRTARASKILCNSRMPSIKTYLHLGLVFYSNKCLQTVKMKIERFHAQLYSQSKNCCTYLRYELVPVIPKAPYWAYIWLEISKWIIQLRNLAAREWIKSSLLLYFPIWP